MSEVENKSGCCQNSQAESLITKHVYGAVATGMIPVPAVDVVALLGIQVNLVRKLSEIYGKTFKENTVKNIIGPLVGSVTPVALTPMAFSLLKAVPVVGYTASALTLSVLGGGSTYAIGRIFDKHFANGGTIEDLSVEKVKDDFAKEYEVGKNVAKNAAKDKEANPA